MEATQIKTMPEHKFEQGQSSIDKYRENMPEDLKKESKLVRRDEQIYEAFAELSDSLRLAVRSYSPEINGRLHQVDGDIVESMNHDFSSRGLNASESSDKLRERMNQSLERIIKEMGEVISLLSNEDFNVFVPKIENLKKLL